MSVFRASYYQGSCKGFVQKSFWFHYFSTADWKYCRIFLGFCQSSALRIHTVPVYILHDLRSEPDDNVTHLFWIFILSIIMRSCVKLDCTFGEMSKFEINSLASFASFNSLSPHCRKLSNFFENTTSGTRLLWELEVTMNVVRVVIVNMYQIFIRHSYSWQNKAQADLENIAQEPNHSSTIMRKQTRCTKKKKHFDHCWPEINYCTFTLWLNANHLLVYDETPNAPTAS